MSPPALRRYRAERLIRQEFVGQRRRVMATARGMLRVNGVTLDPSDLEACYAQAWQGLYLALLEGQEVASPTGWLALVTFRRAIEEHRARVRAHCGNAAGGSRPIDTTGPERGGQGDLAAELDDRVKLRQLFEGLRAQLSKRELQAATLCYLQGFSRSEAAAQMGVSEKRMSKLMEGRGPGRPGVASKVGTLVQAIGRGDWCDEQGSLMRGFAYGILDPAGERYQLAVGHHSQCPACRAYVASLRGLAAVLPLPPLPLSLIAAVAAGARAGGAGARTSAGATGLGARAAGSGAEAAGPGIAGAGGAGGGWLVAGGAGAKLALGCAVAVSIGAGCVALSTGPVVPRRAHHVRAASKNIPAKAIGQQLALPALAAAPSPATSGSRKSAPPAPPAGGTAQAPGSTPSRRASSSPPKANREFGIEQPGGSVSSSAGRGPAEPRPGEPRQGESPQASAATAGSHPGSTAPGEEAANAPAPPSTSAAQPSGGAAAAEREFGPG